MNFKVLWLLPALLSADITFADSGASSQSLDINDYVKNFSLESYLLGFHLGYLTAVANSYEGKDVCVRAKTVTLEEWLKIAHRNKIANKETNINLTPDGALAFLKREFPCLRQ